MSLAESLSRWSPPGQTRIPFPSKLGAFVGRGFKIWWSYKLWVALDLLGTISFVLVYWFLSTIVSPERIRAAGYGESFFSFALVGIAYYQFLWASVQSLSRAIRDEQWMGTMETLLSGATSFPTVLLGESLYRFIEAAVFLVAALLVGAALGPLGLILTPATVLSALVLSLFLVTSHVAIGLFSAAMVLRIKEGDPVVWAFNWFNNLLSGVLYPIALLPPALAWVAQALPLTYALDGIRRVLLRGETLAGPAIQGDLAFLLLWTSLMLPLGLLAFRQSLRSVKRRGELGTY
ncbi:MAG: ABC transporter permease [Euryarchaeota archaeon]|nr:ABC transporter permease [Euryarchaeota archaeon]